MCAKTILVVEDNPINMDLVVDILELAGYVVIQAANAEAGIELANQKKPDLILMDISLPGMDGLEATRILKSRPDTAIIPVVALTAHAMKGDNKKIQEAGCSGHITKPIDTRDFPRRVKALMEA